MSDVWDRPLHGIAVYNPRLLSKAELIGFFVARQAEHERIVEALRREAKAQPQHHLVVGARGMGKTTLLHRLRYSIEDDEELAARCLGLVFPEEQYNVVCLADFWLNCVDALADALESRGQLELVEGLDEEIARIQAVPQRDDRGRQALALLGRLSDRLSRRLVLLVDNVDLVLDRLQDEQWALREVLSSESRIQLVGATSAPLESHYRHDMAFYDFFRVHHLEGLDDEETFTVLRRLAEVTGQAQVARLLDAEPARVRTVRLMAGGNPRTVVLLFNVLAQGTDGDVRTDIERLLDQCTPLYKHRLEVLPMQAQQVLDAVAKHWDPATAVEIATATHLKVNVVSTQLDRLVKDGTLEKVSLPHTKRHGFQIAERFFNIWCLMRASRRARRRLVWLVEFLRLMFGAEELALRARRHLGSGARLDGLRGAELGLAFADVVEDGLLRTALETQSLRAMSMDPLLRKQLAELLDLEGQDKHLVSRAERLRMLAEAREAVMAAKVDLPGWDAAEYWELLAGCPGLRVQNKLQTANMLHTGTAIDVITNFPPFYRAIEKEAFVDEEYEDLSRAVRDGKIDVFNLSRDELEAARRFGGDASLVACALALAASRGVQVDPAWLANEAKHSRSLLPWLLWAKYSVGGDTEPEAVWAKLHTVIEAYSWGACGLETLGRFLHYDLGRLDDAEHAFRRALAQNPRLWTAEFSLARVLIAKRGDMEAAKRLAVSALEKPHGLHLLGPQVLIEVAEIFVLLDDWARAEPLVQSIASAGDDVLLRSGPAAFRLFTVIVNHGFIIEARALLASTGTAERWEPLDRALEIIEHGDPSILERLAPEMQEAVRLVLARISPSTLADDP